MITFEDLNEVWKAEKFAKMDIGSAVVQFGEFSLTIWVGKNNVSLMVNKEEITAMEALMKNSAAE